MSRCFSDGLAEPWPGPRSTQATLCSALLCTSRNQYPSAQLRLFTSPRNHTTSLCGAMACVECRVIGFGLPGSVNREVVPAWRNWQTQTLHKCLGASPSEFESRRRYPPRHAWQSVCTEHCFGHSAERRLIVLVESRLLAIRCAMSRAIHRSALCLWCPTPRPSGIRRGRRGRRPPRRATRTTGQPLFAIDPQSATHYL